jgi:hypothetical protein
MPPWTGHRIGTYAWTNTSPDALAAVTHRVAHLQQQYPNRLPTTALHEWDTSLPIDTYFITLKWIVTSFTDGIDIVLANLIEIPIAKSTNAIIHHHEQNFKHVARLIQFLHKAQPTGIAYILANTPSSKLYPHMRLWLTPIITLDGPQCGSAAYRQTHICQNITPNANIQEKFSQLPIPIRTTNDQLSHANIHHSKTHPTNIQPTIALRGHVILPLLLNIALPKFASYPHSQAYCVRFGIPRPGLMYY